MMTQLNKALAAVDVFTLVVTMIPENGCELPPGPKRARGILLDGLPTMFEASEIALRSPHRCGGPNDHPRQEETVAIFEAQPCNSKAPRHLRRRGASPESPLAPQSRSHSHRSSPRSVRPPLVSRSV
jgi:hypothetical protein